MSALFLAPHNDDESLFGAFLIQRDNAHVIVALRSFVEAERWPHATYHVRENETAQAVDELGATWEQWNHDDRRPDWSKIRDELEAIDTGWSVVYAPALEVGGHDHHNALGSIAEEVFSDRVQFYSTYTRHGGRTALGDRVAPEPEWIVRKLRALARYESQIEIDAMRPHFLRGLDEYLIP